MKLRALVAAMAAVGLLVACGGGGGGGDTPASTPTPTPTGVTLTGVVASGLALSGATVTAKCATGTATATSSSNGSYTFTIASGSLPCVLRAVAADSSMTLHSVASGSGAGSGTSNITPVTELLVAQLTGSTPATYYADSGTVAALASTVTDAKVTAAQTSVVQTLQSAGVDTTAITNALTQTLVPATGTTTGNGYDQVLEALKAKLTAAGTTLTTLTTTVAQTAATTSSGSSNTSSTTAATASNVVSLPADLLLKPKASNCDALRSTTYRVIKFAPSNGSTLTAVETINVDAATLTISNAANAADSWTWTANGTCRYSSADGADIVVSPAGVIVARALIGTDDTTVDVTARGTYRMVLAIPVQNIALADMAGTWNALSWERQGAATVFSGNSGTFDVGADGFFTRVACFDDGLFVAASACTSDTTLLPRLSAHSAGGFTLASTDPADVWSDRAFAFRGGNGDLMLVVTNLDGDVFLATKQRTLNVPAVGTITTGWNVTTNPQNLATPTVSATRNEILTADSTTGVFTRASTSVGDNTSTHTQTLTRNAPRPGYTRRTAASNVPTAGGGTTTVREFMVLGLRGVGLSAGTLPNTATAPSNNSSFFISVDQ